MKSNSQLGFTGITLDCCNGSPSLGHNLPSIPVCQPAHGEGPRTRWRWLRVAGLRSVHFSSQPVQKKKRKKETHWSVLWGNEIYIRNIGLLFPPLFPPCVLKWVAKAIRNLSRLILKSCSPGGCYEETGAPPKTEIQQLGFTARPPGSPSLGHSPNPSRTVTKAIWYRLTDSLISL